MREKLLLILAQLKTRNKIYSKSSTEFVFEYRQEIVEEWINILEEVTKNRDGKGKFKNLKN